MPWRFSMSLATVLLAATSSLVRAQGPMPPHTWGPPPGSQGMVPACPPGGMGPAYYGQACPPGRGGAPYQPVDPDIFYDSDSQIDLVIRETIRRSWMRVEFLHWNIKDPGNHLLGAETATVDPREPFPAFDPGNIQRAGVTAFVPTTGDVKFDSLPGMRLTIGAPTEWGTFEADIWAIMNASTTLSFDPEFDGLTGLTNIPAVTLTVNGGPSDTQMILFDNGYDAELRSGMWGTQGNWIGNPVTPQNTLCLSPVVGLRYIKFDEELRISGNDIATGTSPRITSKSNNNFVGPQVGVRASLDSKWMSLGLEPKVMLGINRHQDSVRTSQIFDVSNPNTLSTNEDTDFAPAFNLPGYAKLHLSENFSFFAGYELLWLSNATRATEQVVYDSPAISTNPGQIRVKKHREQVYAHGFMVGGELRFR
ncbi:BBP7 family outer membrane beta-barrel protein [Caulifigura coniformis]|nr:BBP7 family outer membrane beta-barrel protein [Caulifigura coniformis]